MVKSFQHKNTKMSIVILFMILTLVSNVGSAKELIILGNENKPPKIYLDESAQPKGILVDIVKYVGKEAGYSFNIKLYPWIRAYTYALDGRGGIIGLSKTSERLKIFDYSEVVYYDEVLMVVLKGKEFHFETIEDLRGKIVAIGRGGSYGEEFEKGKRSKLFEVSEDDNPPQRLTKLLLNRIDVALIGPGKVGFYEVIKQDTRLIRNKNKFSILPKPFKRDPNFLGISKKLRMENFLKKFNQVIKMGYETGKIPKIIDQYVTD